VDSITQIALGAAVGEATLGRKVGNKAAAWGAALGTLPDLDVLAYPFLSEAGELLFHRGPTHAILFSFVAGPAFGWLLARIHRRDGASATRWSMLAFAAFLTHTLLDSFTAYGTQLLLPFSRDPVAFNTISIIDPLYTVPLLVGIVGAMLLRRDRTARSIFNYFGLASSTLYLVLTVATKLHVVDVARDNLSSQGLSYDRLEVMPSLFNNILWVTLAADADTVWAGTHSLLDEENEMSFQAIPKREYLLPADARQGVTSVLFWFSRELFSITEESGELYFNDLHIGRTDFFLSEEGDPIFRYELQRDERGRIVDIVSDQPSFTNRSDAVDAFICRILGEPRGKGWRGRWFGCAVRAEDPFIDGIESHD
jgi:inner membrane protein